MARPVRIAILADSRNARGEIAATGTALGRLEKSASRAGKVVALGAVVAGAALVKLGLSAVRAASDSQQSIGATESVFKQYSDTVIRRSERAAEAVGLSANEYRELSNQVGAMLKNTGRPLKETADLSAKLTKRAADMSAMFGGTTREALEAVSAALRGEADPIERFGVSIKESGVMAYLAAKGQEKLEGAALDQAKAQARVALIFDQTKDAAGQFGRESDTLAGKQQRLSAKAENLKAKLGTALLPVMTDLADVADEKLVPAVERGVAAFEEWWPSAVQTSTALGKKLLPVLESTGEVLETVTDFVKGIPGPLLVMGVQAGVAAVVFPRLAAGVTAAGVAMRNGTIYARVLGLEMQTAAGRATLASGAMARMGGVARGAAGIGGMVALTQGATASNEAVGALAKVGGGALLGFSMGGPIGAAIGGAGGALYALATKADDATDSTKNLAISTGALKVSKDQVTSLAESYDEVSGAATRATRKQLRNTLVTGEHDKLLQSIGISTRDAISAQLGNEDAIKRVNRAFRESNGTVAAYQGKVSEAEAAYISYAGVLDNARAAGGPVSREDSQHLIDLRAELDGTRDALGAQEAKLLSAKNAWTTYSSAEVNARAEMGQTKYDLANLGAGLKAAFPDKPRRSKVVTELEVLGGPPTFGQLRQLRREYKLTPKQVRTIVTTTGAKVSAREMDVLTGKAKTLGKQAPKVRIEADGKRASGGLGILQRALDGIKRTKVKGPDMKGPVRASANAAAGTAKQGGASLGRNLSLGTAAGISANSGPVAAAASAMVRAALAAANREAQVRSPSRKTRKLGHYMGAGLAAGLGASMPRTTAAMTRLTRAVLKAAESGTRDVSAVFAKGLEKDAKRRVREYNRTHKSEKARARFAKKVALAQRDAAKGIRLEATALAANRTAHAAKVQHLKDETAKYGELKQARLDYIASVQQGFVEYGSLGNLTEGHLNDPGSLLEQLEARTKKAEAFGAMLETLRKQGLSEESLQQLVDAGVDGGTAQAQAIIAGGPAMVKSINALQTRISNAGLKLGTSLGNQFHNAGIQAQEGLIKGLTSDIANLEKAGNVLAKALIKAIKKELKIKSPSRVMALLGRFTGQGLAGGVKGTATLAEQAGEHLARAVQTGAASLAPVIPITRAVLDPAVVDGSGVRGGSDARVISIRLSAEQVDQLRRGREYHIDTQAYLSAGGRTAS